MEPGQFKQTNFLFYGLHQEQFSHAELLSACQAALHAERLETAPLSDSVVKALVASSLFEVHGDGLRFGRNLAFINAGLTKQLLIVAETAAQTYTRILANELKSLRALASLFSVKGVPMEWKDVAHLIVAGLIIDLGIRDELLAQGVIAEQPDEYWVWAFECGTGTQNAFGVQLWTNETAEAVFGQLWHKKLHRRVQLKIDSEDVALLSDVYERGSIKATNLSHAQHQQALKLSFYRLLSVEHADYVLNIPVLSGTNGGFICAEAKRIARAIFSEAVVPAMSEAQQIFLETGLPQGVFSHAFARLLLECSIDKTVAAELISAFPQTAENNWASWLSLGQCIDELRLRHN